MIFTVLFLSHCKKALICDIRLSIDISSPYGGWLFLFQLIIRYEFLMQPFKIDENYLL